MGNLPEIIALIFRVLPYILFDPIYLMILAVLGVIIYSQYRRVYILQRRMFGLNRGSPLKESLISLGYGLLGGIVASIIFVSLGISLSTTGIAFVWLTALALMILIRVFSALPMQADWSAFST